MHTNTAVTSILSYHQERDSGRIAKSEQRIYELIDVSSSPITRREIALLLRMDRSIVSARVNGLISKGYIKRGPKRPCLVTGKSVETVLV